MDFGNPEAKDFRRKMMFLQLIGLLLFFAGVSACYQGAIRGKLWLGPAMVAAVCTIQILMAIRRWQKEILIIAVTGLTGFILDTLLVLCNVYSVADKTRWILPAPMCVEWILGLWINFGGKMSSTLPGIRGRPKMVAIFSAVFGIMIYRHAAKFGLITLTWDWRSIAIIAASWALLVPQLTRFAEKLVPPLVLPLETSHSSRKTS